MFKQKLKRCIASLLAIIICGGMMCPTTYVYAELREEYEESLPKNVKEVEITDKLKAIEHSFPFYYLLTYWPSNSVGHRHLNTLQSNNTQNSNTEPESHNIYETKKLIKLYLEEDKMETFAWASTFVLAGKFSIDIPTVKLLNGDTNSFTSTVLSKIDDTLPTGTDETNLFQKLNNLGTSQGATTADLSNLNQRMAALMYVRLNPYYLRKGNKYKWKDVESIDNADYRSMLKNTLNIGYDKTLKTRLLELGLITEPEDADLVANGRALNNNFEYSANVLGVMGVSTIPAKATTDTQYRDEDDEESNKAYSTNNKVFVANEMAMYICLSEYLKWYMEDMKNIANTQSWETNEDHKKTLTIMKTFNDAFGTLIPLINTIYTRQNPDAGNMSIEDMVEKAGANTQDLGDTFTVSTNNYTEHIDNSSPITQFYTIKSFTGITGYDRDQLLNDIDADDRKDEEILAEQEQQNFENATSGENNYEIPNTFLSTQSTVASNILLLTAVFNNKEDKDIRELDWEDPNNKVCKKNAEELIKLISSHEADTLLDVFAVYYGDTYINTLRNAVNSKDYSNVVLSFRGNIRLYLEDIKEGDTEDIIETLNKSSKKNKKSLEKVVDNLIDYGVDENGKAISVSAVTINSLITKGMAYSTSYIPMRTNLYSPTTIEKFKGDNANNEFYNFFIDYGFMRKALYKDTSSSAVMDYYNANGTTTGNLKLCTLRDLIESGDGDVVLYLDSTFYNAKDAIDEGNTVLSGAYNTRVGIQESLTEFASIWKNAGFLTNDATVILSSVKSLAVKNALLSLIEPDSSTDKYKFDVDKLRDKFKETMLSTYKFSIDKFETAESMEEYATNLAYANTLSESSAFSDQTLKTNGYANYNSQLRASLAEVEGSEYKNLSNMSNVNDGAYSDFSINLNDNTINTDDNTDALVLSSTRINQYISGEMTYSQTVTDVEKQTETTNSYTADTGYSPMLSLAYVSCLYRDSNSYTLSNAVENNNPVFMASDDMCSVDTANQWYRNTLINYAMLKNLKGNAQVDITYITDLDCPVYMDIFGNILTESGTVVIPASANATLHTASFKDYNYAAGLYTCYGKEYTISGNLKGVASVLHPFFVLDKNTNKYVINGITMKVNSSSVRFDKIDTYNTETQDALMNAYLASISSGQNTRLNWIAMVKIANEVMRGAPIEAIDKDQEKLLVNQTKSGLIAAAKFESMLDSLKGETSNTLLSIPDFSRMDNMEYWVALIIKLMMVATAAVVIVSIYRDGVTGKLGFNTFITSAAAIALTVSCIVVVPSVFQLTYYSANKLLLEDEAMRILMVNEEKRQGGAEIGITKVNPVESTGEFALQLDWVTVPWYEELETVLYESSLDAVQETKLKAYRETAIYNNADVTMYNDGAYVTTDDLFDSVSIDFTFNDDTPNIGLYLSANDPYQTASFYSPYYVFLNVLTANINEYNRFLNTSEDNYLDAQSAYDDLENENKVMVIGSYNYTTKFMSGNRLKTVGLSKAYFESDNFMTYDEDLLRLNQIYGDSSVQGNPTVKNIGNREDAYDRATVFAPLDRERFKNSYWYNANIVDYDNLTITLFKKGEDKTNYVNSQIEDYFKKVDAMDKYARDFVASNKDMIGKVSDETFIKVMALSMAIKYNQLFGISSANALEIYNMNSEDLIRLCIIPSDEAVMATSMSYPRFVYSFGGEAGVYVAAILSVIMWVGSFIKPLCTVLVFISIFLSIFVFRVVLKKPSANLFGYMITVILLCVTNIFHAILLKISVNLPSFGLSALGCLVFLIVGQVSYLLILAYVTGIALKDWTNLGSVEYEKEARLLMSKFKPENTSSMLSGKIKHHDNNWDYYNDLVNNHRKRNYN